MNPIFITSPANEWIVQHQVTLRHHFEQCLAGGKRALILGQCLEAVHAVLGRRFVTTVVAVAAVMLLPSLWI